MRPRQFTDEELLEVARRCFLADGPGVSTAKIAGELGVSAAALFRRVGSKAELMRRALGVPTCPDWVTDLEAGPTQAPVREQLLELATRVDDFFRRRLPALAIYRAAGIHPSDIYAEMKDPPPIRAVRGLIAWLQTLIDQGRAATVDPEAIAVAFLSSLQSRHFLHQMCGAGYPTGGDRYLEVVADTFAAAVALPEDKGC